MKINILIVCFFSTSLIFSCYGTNDWEDNYIKDEVGTRNGDKEYIGEGNADIQFEANTLSSQLMSNIALLKNGKICFPDYYGGLYTDKTGKLTINIKGDIEKEKNKILSILPNNNTIIFKSCSFSYQELFNLIENISKQYPKLKKNIKDNLFFYYLSEKDNKIVIGLGDTSKKTIDLLTSSIGAHSAFKFIKVQSKHRSSIPSYKKEPLKQSLEVPGWYKHIHPGDYLRNTMYSNSYYHGSWAFRARDVQDSTIIGIVTAAHVLKHDSAFIGNDFIGIAEVLYYTGSVDAAFVELLPYGRYIGTNILTTQYDGGSYPSQYTNNVELHTDTNLPITGTTINKRGWSTGLTTGEVISTNFNATLQLEDGSTILVQNMTSADFDCDSGDSGSIVYTYYSGPNKRYTTGIVSGVFYDEIGSQYSYFSKANVVLQTLGIERY